MGWVKVVKSSGGFGYSVELGKRVILHSRKGTTRMRPKLIWGGDENCNPSITVVLWPLGHVDVFYKPGWRTDLDSLCDECYSLLRAEGVDRPRDLGCTRPPAGWYCSRYPDHNGPCAAWPIRGGDGKSGRAQRQRP